MCCLLDSVSMPPKKAAGTKKDQPRFGRVKNNLKMGFVGLPNVGKSSLFNLLGDNADAAAENFPFWYGFVLFLFSSFDHSSFMQHDRSQ